LVTSTAGAPMIFSSLYGRVFASGFLSWPNFRDCYSDKSMIL